MVDLVELSGELSAEQFDMLTSGKIQLISAKSSDITLIKNQEINFNLNLNVDQKKLITRLEKAEIQIGGLPFSIDGRVDEDSLQMHISSKAIQLTDVVEKLSIDPENELQKLKGKGTLDFDININGGMGATDPIDVACEFSIKDGQLTETSENLKFEQKIASAIVTTADDLGVYDVAKKFTEVKGEVANIQGEVTTLAKKYTEVKGKIDTLT